MKRRNFYNYLIVCLCLLLCTYSNSQAQENNSDPVIYKISSPTSVQVGETFKLTITFTIQPGWHIYAPIALNEQQGNIVSKVTFKLPDGIELVEALELPGNGAGMDIYTGTIVMSQKLKAVKTIAVSNPLLVKVRYQACNDMICHAVVEEEKKVVINIQGNKKRDYQSRNSNFIMTYAIFLR